MKVVKLLLKYLLAIFFVLVGVNHFRDPAFYLKMMPPYLPYHAALNYLSGGFEIVLGVMLLLAKFRRVAAWGIIALLIAVFPANIYMAMNPERFPDINPMALLVRLPFQALFIAWAYSFTRPDRQTNAQATTLS